MISHNLGPHASPPVTYHTDVAATLTQLSGPTWAVIDAFDPADNVVLLNPRLSYYHIEGNKRHYALWFCIDTDILFSFSVIGASDVINVSGKSSAVFGRGDRNARATEFLRLTPNVISVQRDASSNDDMTVNLNFTAIMGG